MPKLRPITTIVVAGMSISGIAAAADQSYPARPVRIITSEIGGGTDIAARLIADGVAGSLGQAIVIDNRPSGIILIENAVKAAPDGYTLLVITGTLWIGPLLQKMPYDTLRDFSPITLTNRQPNILVVHPSLPVTSVKELIALAKARPGELNYASGGTGGSPHLAAELFKSMAGVNIVRIAYKGSAQAQNDLLSGQVQLTFGTPASVTPRIKSGQVRALAVTSAERSVLLPELPTIAASGLPGYESAGMTAMFAPAKTPVEIISKLNQTVVRFLQTPEAKDKFLRLGVEAIGSSPEQLDAAIRSEVARMGKVIKDAGIRAE